MIIIISKVVWERLIVGGDNIQCISSLTLLLRIAQYGMVIYVVYHIIKFDHNPEFFVEAGCLESEERYWVWYSGAVAACVFTLVFGVIEAMIECAMIKISGMGTLTRTDGRAPLVALCKCNTVPMFLCRLVGFAFALVAVILTDKFCNCAYSSFGKGVVRDRLIVPQAPETGMPSVGF